MNNNKQQQTFDFLGSPTPKEIKSFVKEVEREILNEIIAEEKLAIAKPNQLEVELIPFYSEGDIDSFLSDIDE